MDGNSRKSILLSAASYFENALANIVEEFARNSSANTMVGDLIKARVISRQYQTWFDWDKNNANKFYQMFGDVFREHMTSLVRNRVQFDEAAKAFLEIGRDRNRLVHQDFGSFTVEKTTSEIYDQYKKARGFVEMVERELDYCCSKATTRGL
ncbi:HEPN domain-containing protein [Mesorhizobium sp. M1380]|uniref:HEPN domain-containing protein n=1 Tax=Mesorhizobium sp. M1380 TaxID=2957093 RepID=UPI00333DEE90